MPEISTNGNCYICGSTLSKASFKKHILAKHECDAADSQECVILEVEDAYEKAYWLYLDVPKTSTLKTLDTFLRDIWLECCGHMSAFFVNGFDEISKSSKIGEFRSGSKLHYEYDFGSTTELLITFAGTHRRPKQRKSVRLLGRNEPPRFTCANCGKEADFICCECAWSEENPFICEECMAEHPHESALPVVNSPRMGVCGYCGEQDVYEFDPEYYEK